MLKPKTEIGLPAVFLSTLLLNAGASFMWPLVTVYMHNYLGKTLTLAGTTLFVMSMFMILGNYVGGYLFDRWSPYKTAIGSVIVSLVAMILLIFFHNWPMFGILLAVVGFGDGASMTVGNSYAASVKSKSTRSVFNILYIGINLGVVIGTLLVGYLMHFGITVVLTVTSLFYVVLLIITAIEFPVHLRASSKSTPHGEVAAKFSNLSIVLLICFLVFSLYLSYALWESVLSVHMTSLNISFEKYSLLWTLNGLMIVVLQPIANRIGANYKMSSQIYVGVTIFAASFFLLIFANQYLVFIITMAILTIGEMIGFPGIPAWIDSLSDESQKGKYQGMFNVALSLGRAVGPLFGGMMIDLFSYQTLFLSVTALMLGAMLVVIFRYRTHTKRSL